MIYTVTFNPSLDYIVSVEDFRLSLTNRTDSELLLPGGKGINVSIVLGNLGIPSTALGFIAGFTGDEVARRLKLLGIKNGFIRIEEGFTRINLKLKSIDGTEINGQGPAISKEKLEKLMEQLDGLEQGDILFLSGSIPASVPDDVYQKIMERLYGRGVQIVVDATKDLLVNVLSYYPFLIKPNNHEISRLLNQTLRTPKELKEAAKGLMKKYGIAEIVVSMGAEGALYVTGDETIYAEGLKVTVGSTVGAGDSVVAALAVAQEARMPLAETVRLSTATGAANVMCSGTQAAEYAVIQELMPKVVYHTM